MSGKLVILMILTAIISGCATSSDPRKGGFIGGLMGINSGAYDSRIQQRKNDLSQQENINQDLKDRSKSLEDEANASETELASEQQLLDDMEDDLASLESDVSKLTAQSDKQKADIADLKRKIEKQRRQLQSQQAAIKALDRSGGRASNPDRYRILQKERNRLADEYKKLMVYFQALNDAAK
jgi:chromosome segregation ATPase